MYAYKDLIYNALLLLEISLVYDMSEFNNKTFIFISSFVYRHSNTQQCLVCLGRWLL